MKKFFLFFVIFLTLGQKGFAAGNTKPGNDVKLEKATFAGGCFWCMEPVFDRFQGVHSTIVGYTGGEKDNPTYDDVSMGTTGHAEAIEVVYDPAQVSYGELLNAFWKSINPTTKNRQFADAGTQYRTGIFYHNEEQKRLAEESKAALEKSGRYDQPIVTEIVPASKFYPAEEYHQDYYKKNSSHYEAYKEGSGRAGYLRKMWGK